jgi:hypothetical protein
MTNVNETNAILLCMERSFMNEHVSGCDALHYRLLSASHRLA